MASASNVASGPMMTCTRFFSTSSWVFAFACGGVPPVSAMISSTLRPASVLLRSLRKSSMPCSICLPPAASGPVRTVRKPMRSGSPCACRPSVQRNTQANAAIQRSRCMAFPLLRFDAGVLDHLGVNGDLGVDVIAELPGRHVHGVVAEVHQLFLDARVGERLAHVGVDLVDHARGSTGWRPDP